MIKQALKILKNNSISEVILGTAQFGMNYGLNEESRSLDRDKIFKILNQASRSKITIVDTAHSYGSSEKIIGDWMSSSNKNKMNIITKIPRLLVGHGSKEANHYLSESMRNLGVTSIDTLLMHEAKDIFKQDIISWVESLLYNKKIKWFGVSVYNIKDILPIHPSISVIQIPLNIFNQINLEEDLVKNFIRKGGQIHIRSVFVQGLILMNPSKLPKYFESCKEPIKKFQSLAKEAGVLPESLAIASVKYLLPQCKIIMGVHSHQQLAANAKLLGDKIDRSIITSAIKLGNLFSGNMCDPRLWK